MTEDTKIRIRRSEAARYLQDRYGMGSVAYLEKLATVSIGGGPKFVKIGHQCLYTITDLDDWALNRIDGRSLRYKKPDQQADGVTPSTVGGDHE